MVVWPNHAYMSPRSTTLEAFFRSSHPTWNSIHRIWRNRLSDLLQSRQEMPLAEDVNIEELANRTEKFSGADLGALVSEAVMLSIRECVLAGKGNEEAQVCEYRLEAKHFEEALKKVQPTASEEEIYKRFAKVA